MHKFVGLFLIILGLFALGFVVYKNTQLAQTPRTFSSYAILASSWQRYKEQFVNQDGRVIDYTQGDITTSEGQSYAMLRAVWIDDKDSFDQFWKWTRENLKQENSNIFGWRWGKKEDNSYGFLSNGGENTAADANSDIALALIFASRKWNDGRYLEDARKILDDIWKQETDVILGKRFLIAGNWAKQADKIIINPSYFSPYAWRVFSKVDTQHNWNSLIDPAYEILNQASNERIDKPRSVGLPPDWFAVNRLTGKIEPPNLDGLKTNYSFDAIRVPFRIALDYRWFNEDRARKYLEMSFRFLDDYYTKSRKLPTSFSHEGEVLIDTENPSMYATSLGYFITVKPSVAKKIYLEKIVKLYSNEKDNFKNELPYYDQNWLWFGAALYQNFLMNLF